MLSIAQVVRDVISLSPYYWEGIRGDYVNYSAVARIIKPEVEQRAKKSVQITSIIVALTRIKDDFIITKPLIPPIKINSFSLQSSLVELTYPKSERNIIMAQKLAKDKAITESDFLTTTYGVNEISIIIKKELLPVINEQFPDQSPKLFLENLAALSLQFDKKYIEIPNLFYGVFHAFATKGINIIEVVSTFTEMTLILSEDDSQSVLSLLHDSFKSNVQIQKE